MVQPHPAVGGRWAERRVQRLLEQQGWRLLDRNWRCRWGELDLVLTKPKRLLVVEVKGRTNSGPDGSGLAALRHAKCLRLHRTCLQWLANHPDHHDDCVMLVGALVSLPPRRRPVRWVNLTAWG